MTRLKVFLGAYWFELKRLPLDLVFIAWLLLMVLTRGGLMGKVIATVIFMVLAPLFLMWKKRLEG